LVREYSWSEIKANSNVDMSTYSEWGPAVEARAQELLTQYKSSNRYASDVAKMTAADSEYKPPY
jgi:hypothetical protein